MTLRGCTSPDGDHSFPVGEAIPPNAPCFQCGDRPTDALGVPSSTAGAARWPDPPDVDHYATVQGRCQKRFCGPCRRVRAAISSGLVVDPFPQEGAAW